MIRSASLTRSPTSGLDLPIFNETVEGSARDPHSPDQFGQGGPQHRSPPRSVWISLSLLLSSLADSLVTAVPQPWHASSTLVHEGALGVAAALAEQHGGNFNAPAVAGKFQEFFFELMDSQKVSHCFSDDADRVLNELGLSLGLLR